jgi:hypothetical protein
MVIGGGGILHREQTRGKPEVRRLTQAGGLPDTGNRYQERMPSKQISGKGSKQWSYRVTEITARMARNMQLQ